MKPLDQATLALIRRKARHFGMDPALIRAIVEAEGNIIKAVQCSLPAVTTLDEALSITCRSAARAMSDWVKANQHAEKYVTFFGNRWAPVGVSNDPKGLNKNWPKNVYKLWTKHLKG